MAEKLAPSSGKYELVEKNLNASSGTMILKFKPLEIPVSFRPGGFVKVSGIDKSDPTGSKTFRPVALSVASGPSSAELRFYIVKNPAHGGKVHESYFNKMELGDKVKVTSTNTGDFCLDVTQNNPLLFIAASGSGEAPFRGMLDELENRGLKRDIVLVVSIRKPEELVEAEKLRQLVRDGILTDLRITVTRPEGTEWNGLTRRVTDNPQVLDGISNLSEREAYLCGGPRFVVETTKYLKEKRGIKTVKADQWEAE